MRIVHIFDSLEVGGAEKVVCSLARAQRRSGHAVMVHCMFRSGSLSAELISNGVEVAELNVTGTISGVSLLKTFFAKWRPDVVHCHNVSATILGAPAARWFGAPTVISTRHGLGRDVGRRVREMKFWIAARFCNAVVGVCQAASEKLSSNIYSQPRKIVTIQNGAEPAPTSSVGNSAPEKHDFTVVHVARLNWAKDQMSLLRAIAHVRLKRPHVALWIVGDGPEKSKLSAEADRLGISDLVVFAGEQRFVGDWLAKADVFVLSSVSEGLPISLIEATAAGVPSVVTDVGGMPDVIDTCGIGKVVPPRNPEVLRDAILFFADERRRSTSVRQAIRSCYQSHFTIGRMAEEYAVLYERNGRGNGRQ